jgi:hypothetical protein
VIVTIIKVILQPPYPSYLLSTKRNTAPHL